MLYPAIAVAAIGRGKQYNVPGQIILVGLLRRNISVRSPQLADNPPGRASAELVLLASRIDSLLRAYKFPAAMSFKTCFSSERSATNFLSRPFSTSSCFSLELISNAKDTRLLR